MPYKLEDDADARIMLDELGEFYCADDGHIIRKLLADRLEKIRALRTL